MADHVWLVAMDPDRGGAHEWGLFVVGIASTREKAQELAVLDQERTRREYAAISSLYDATKPLKPLIWREDPKRPGRWVGTPDNASDPFDRDHNSWLVLVLDVDTFPPEPIIDAYLG